MKTELQLQFFRYRQYGARLIRNFAAAVSNVEASSRQGEGKGCAERVLT